MKTNIALKFIEDLIKSDPQRAADIFENMDFREASNLFKKLSIQNQIQCFKYFNPKFAAKIIFKLPYENTKEILTQLDKYKIVSIIKNASENKIKNLINNLDQNIKSSIYYLFDYPKNSAARLMYPEFVTIKKNLTVKEAIHKLKLLAKFGELKSYIYVINEENNLCGVINTRDLIISDDDKKIEEIMIKNVIKVSPYTHREELVKIFSARNFISLPVVDSTGKVLGIIESKDVLESAREETVQDIQLLLGSNPDEKIDSPFTFKLKHRSKWLIINLLTVFLSAIIVALFENTIALMTALAIILPMIIGQGAATGSQTLSVIIRSIVMNEIDFRNIKTILYNEILLGFINGLISGLITGIIFWLWKDNFMLGIVVFIAMTLNLIIAGISGTLIPIIMKKLNFDPAHSSIVILTTITDIAGLFILLSLGTAFLI